MLRVSSEPKDCSERTSQPPRWFTASRWLLPLWAAAAAVSCTASQQSTIAPSASRCTVTLPDSLETSAAGGSGTLSIGLARDCSWTASSGAAWVVITSANSGQGGGSITYRVAANPEAAPRRTTIDVNDARATVNQAAACIYRVGPLSAGVDGAGGTVTVHVETEAACAWTAATEAGWIRLDAGASGQGNGAVNLTVDRNGGGTRSGTIRVAGHTVTLTQASVSCAYNVTSTIGTIPAAGGSAAVTVSGGGHCPWTATSSVPWITIGSGAAGTGAGSVQLNIAANPGAARVGALTIATQTVTVTQAAAPCTFATLPATIDVPSAGGERTTNVTTRSDCAWTATATVSWITVTAGAAATGAGTVRFSVAANGDDARSGALRIGGQTVSVAQEAAPCTFGLSTTSQRYDAAGGYGSVNVTARSSCRWTVVPNNGDWLIADHASASGNGVVPFLVAVNPGPQRNGTLTIAGQTFWVTQDPCTFGIQPVSQSMPAVGGTGTVTITTARTCPWTALSNNADWLTVLGGSPGTGTGPFTFSAAPNTTGVTRTGTIRIVNETFTLIQIWP